MGEGSVFEINLLFCAPLGCIHLETMQTRIFLCTPLVYSYDYCVKKCTHIGRTCPKNVRPAVQMCAPGAVCTVNFEHWGCLQPRGLHKGNASPTFPTFGLVRSGNSAIRKFVSMFCIRLVLLDC